jgi:pre-rRNA-processing protein TSR4
MYSHVLYPVWRTSLNNAFGEQVSSSGHIAPHSEPLMRSLVVVVFAILWRVLRYDLSGVPLPFASDAMYKRLFPLAHSVTPTPGTPVIATGGNEGTSTGASDGGGKRVYDPTVIPPCDACGGPRAFECQLMPNLINVLRQARRAREDPDARSGRKTKKTQTDEERRAEVVRLLCGETKNYGEEAAENGDMEWGTCMVFSCVQNCCRTKSAEGKWSDAQVVWKDEYVLVQWDA